ERGPDAAPAHEHEARRVDCTELVEVLTLEELPRLGKITGRAAHDFESRYRSETGAPTVRHFPRHVAVEVREGFQHNRHGAEQPCPCSAEGLPTSPGPLVIGVSHQRQRNPGATIDEHALAVGDHEPRLARRLAGATRVGGQVSSNAASCW